MAETTIEPLGWVAEAPRWPPPLPPPHPPLRYTAQWWRSRAEWEPLKPAWREAHRRFTPDDMGADPDWCEGVEAAYPGALQVVSLRRGGEVVAVVPLILKRADLDCQLGEYKVLRLRPRVLELAGATLGVEDDGAAYDAFFAALLDGRPRERGCDAFSFTAPTQSRLWAYLNRTAWAGHRLRRYQPAPPVAHHRIRMAASFDAYLAKFTPKTRKNRLRELKRLQRRGTVELACYRRPEQVDAFLDAAQAISCRSYQHKLLGAGLRAPARLRPRLRIAAAHGWLRSYVLRCGGAACSYMLGYQYQGHYHYTTVGYDPAWKDLCVGTVLQLLVLQEMHERDPPRLFDFGAQAPQKQYFGNEQFEEATMLLFERGAYPWAARALHQWSRRVTRGGGRILDRYELKPIAQRLLRRLRGC